MFFLERQIDKEGHLSPGDLYPPFPIAKAFRPAFLKVFPITIGYFLFSSEKLVSGKSDCFK